VLACRVRGGSVGGSSAGIRRIGYHEAVSRPERRQDIATRTEE
jgi:hypothetical protein